MNGCAFETVSMRRWSRCASTLTFRPEPGPRSSKPA